MSLRTALAALPDDRGTVHAAYEIIACFVAHVGEPMTVTRISRATALEVGRVQGVIEALVTANVIDCDGNPSRESCVFEPGAVLQLEVERYLRSGNPNAARMQSSLGKFRSRLGQG
jgi:hypothetical protein